MNTTADQIKPDEIECSICLTEIPSTEAKIFEAQDYIQYYCGLDCYEKLQKQST